MLFFIILLCYNIIINNILLYYIKLVSEELYRRYLEMSRDIEGCNIIPQDYPSEPAAVS